MNWFFIPFAESSSFRETFDNDIEFAEILVLFPRFASKPLNEEERLICLELTIFRQNIYRYSVTHREALDRIGTATVRWWLHRLVAAIACMLSQDDRCSNCDNLAF